MKRPTPLIILLVGLTLPAVAIAGGGSFPTLIPLPDEFAPEGIATGRGTEFFVGSTPTGAIYKGDLRTGDGSVLLVPSAPRLAVGLAVDRRSDHLFVAGGFLGQAYVYDAATGDEVRVFQLTAPGSLVNDVIVTRQAAYITDSFRPYLYRIPLGPGGRLSPSVVGVLTSPDFRIPATVAGFGNRLYAVNARFDVSPPGVPPPPGTEYEIVGLAKP